MSTVSLRFSPLPEPPSYYAQMPEEAELENVVLLPQENEVPSITVFSKKKWCCAMAIRAALAAGGIYILSQNSLANRANRATGLFERCVWIQHPDICSTSTYPEGHICRDNQLSYTSRTSYYMYVDTVNATQMQDIKSHTTNPRCNIFEEKQNPPNTQMMMIPGLFMFIVGGMFFSIGLMERCNKQQAFG